MKTLIIYVTIVLSFPLLNAKSWHFNSIYIKANVNPDGSMHVSEARSYHFNGRFSWADYQLSGLENQKIENFKIRDENITYSESDSEQEGTYIKETRANQFYCKWHYQAKNESKTFKLDYTIRNVIQTYDDVAELYWKFIGESNPAWVDTVSITIRLPRAASFADVKTWAHGPLWGNVMITRDHILLTVNDLPQKQFVEARVIFPPQWVPGSPVIGGLKESLILAQEKERAEQANRERQKAIIEQEIQEENNARAYDISMPMGLSVIILFVFLYWRYGRGFTVNYTQKTDPNIPDDRHPALLNAIYFNNNVGGTTLSTTLFRLAQKGILFIQKDETRQKKWYDSADPVIIKLDHERWQNSKNTLQDFENNLIEFLFGTISDGKDEVTSQQMKKASSKMQKWFRQWQKIVKSHLKETPYFDRESIKGAIINGSVALVICILSVLVIISLGENGLYAFVPALLTFFLSFTILRYTPEIKLLKKKLAALRNYLKTFGTTSYSSSALSTINDYFLFVIALGLGKKYTQQILREVPVDQQAVLFPWFIYGASGNPADFASAINSVVSATATSVSSAAGAGGGMSAGGGAGAGGAAGGAG